MRPYNEIIHPGGCRNFTEYSNGIIGDMGVHMFDMARWMLDLGWPRRIHSQGGIQVQTDAKANTADTQTATFDFDDVTMTWQHRSWGTPTDPDYPWAAFFYGDEGTLKASVKQYDFIPEGDGEPLHGDVVYELDEYPVDQTEEDLEKHVAPALRRHFVDFLEAIDTNRQPRADIEEGHISTTSCILANLSRRLGRSLEWDPDAGRVKGDEEANRLLSRPYRDPWTHPTPDTV
jgi:predicted dehydrogenase